MPHPYVCHLQHLVFTHLLGGEFHQRQALNEYLDLIERVHGGEAGVRGRLDSLLPLRRRSGERLLADDLELALHHLELLVAPRDGRSYLLQGAATRRLEWILVAHHLAGDA